jgi:hypothetical protein
VLRDPLSKSAAFEEIELLAGVSVFTVDATERAFADNFAAVLKPADSAFAYVGRL